PRSRSDRHADLAPGRSRLEAHAAEGRHRLGLYARTDGARGYRRRAARPARHTRVQGRVRSTLRDLPDGYAAGPGGLLAYFPLRVAGGRGGPSRPSTTPHPFRIACSAQTIGTREMTAVRRHA